MKVIGIQRAKCFSPNSVEKDYSILYAVVSPFGGKIIAEEELSDSLTDDNPDVVFSMARGDSALTKIECLEKEGKLVINPSEGVRRCRRSTLDSIIKENHLPIPTIKGDDSTLKGYWLKRGDGSAESHDDVVFCKDKTELESAEQKFIARGITDYIVQPHVEGDLVKFYGVEGTGFFRTFYPSDDGESKFGDEAINGKAHHYFYQKDQLQAVAEQISRLAEAPVYGGDAIVKRDGDFVIIDFNDWPSFSRCRDEAAKAIINLARYSI